MSHIALICDDHTIQPQLPQIILMAAATARLADVVWAREAAPNNVHMWRLKSGWISNEVFPAVIRMIARSLQIACPERQPILLMDAHKVHCSKPTLQTCSKCGIWPVIIPASCTHFLQPLDTDVFAAYKRHIRSGMHARMTVGPNADLSLPQVLEIVCCSIRSILQGRKWADVFQKSGFGHVAAELRPSLLRQLQWEGTPQFPPSLPSLQAFQAIFPAHLYIEFDALFAGVTRRSSRPSKGSKRQGGGSSEPLAGHTMCIGETVAERADVFGARGGVFPPEPHHSSRLGGASSSSDPWRSPFPPSAVTPWTGPVTRSRSKLLEEESQEVTSIPVEEQPPAESSQAASEPEGRRLPRAVRLPSFRSITRSTP